MLLQQHYNMRQLNNREDGKTKGMPPGATNVKEIKYASKIK